MLQCCNPWYVLNYMYIVCIFYDLMNKKCVKIKYFSQYNCCMKTFDKAASKKIIMCVVWGSEIKLFIQNLNFSEILKVNSNT